MSGNRDTTFHALQMGLASVAGQAVRSSFWRGLGQRWNAARYGFRKLSLFVELFISAGRGLPRR